MNCFKGGVIPKLVFAPPVGARPVNVHVRTDGSQDARDTLPFGDYRRSEVEPRSWWESAERSIVERATTIAFGSGGGQLWSKLAEIRPSVIAPDRGGPLP
jgi:hypothetical protein